MNWWDVVFWEAVLAGAIRLGTPVALAAIGETIVEKSGILNLGIEGIMTIGAFTAIFVVSVGGGWEAALLAAVLVGVAFGLGIAAAVLLGGANQIVVGIAATLIGGGAATYFYQLWDNAGLSRLQVPLVPTWDIPVIRDMPFFGAVISGQSLLTYATVAFVLVILFVLKRTKPGLLLKAAGDQPQAALARGINVVAIRTVALAFGGGLAALGGAAITVGYLGTYVDGVVAGRGYVALAIVITGRWSPAGAAVGALLFAFFDSLALRAQGGSGVFPVEAYQALPYAVTLLVLVLTARGLIAPRALGVPLRRD